MQFSIGVVILAKLQPANKSEKSGGCTTQERHHSIMDIGRARAPTAPNSPGSDAAMEAKSESIPGMAFHR